MNTWNYWTELLIKQIEQHMTNGTLVTLRQQRLESKKNIFKLVCDTISTLFWDKNCDNAIVLRQ